MPPKEKALPEKRTNAGASEESEIVSSSRGFSKEKSKEGKAALGHAILSIWTATLVLVGVLLFSLHQMRGRLQGIQEALVRAGQSNELLLEGLDELLARVERQDRFTETAPPPPEPAGKNELDKVEKSVPDDLPRKYKIYYRAKDGEDLAQVGEKFSVSEDQLRLWNALKASDLLIPGQVLVIHKSTQADKPVEVAHASLPPDDRRVAEREEPAEPEPPPEELPAIRPDRAETKGDDKATEEATVDRSDTAEEPDDSPAVGGGEPAPETLEDVADERPNETVHIVQQGESLSTIGQKHGVSWLALAALNGIDSPGTIYVGQRLKIAETAETHLPTSEVTYRVKDGDNLYRIGRMYDVRWEQIAQANGITHPTHLYAGQVLKIPVAKGGPEF